MKKWILLPAMILTCGSLTGCFGLVVAHPRQKTSEQFCLGDRGVVSNSPSATIITDTNVLERWGEPDSKRNESEGLVVWQYQGKMMWTVVIPAFVFAAPLPFPAGHNQVEIYFKDGIAQKAQRRVAVTTGVFIGTGMVFAWEKEEGDKPDHGVIVGSGFEEPARPGQ